MSIRTLLISAGLLIAVGTASSQPSPKPTSGGAPTSPKPAPPTLVRPYGDWTPTPLVNTPVTSREKSVEELLTELESIRAQKAELERKEKELKAAIGKKLEEQTERLKKLGLAPPAAKDAEPDRVGRIIIEGNTKTPDRKILEKLELQPGQILQYPKLEKCRAALEKAGFRNVVVEVVPNELDSTFKDIRVKIDESKPKRVEEYRLPPAPKPGLGGF